VPETRRLGNPRVDAGEHRADDAVLAGCIEALEHEEDAAPSLGEEALLEELQPLAEGL
jgi:hypothetical protein